MRKNSKIRDNSQKWDIRSPNYEGKKSKYDIKSQNHEEKSSNYDTS